MCDMQQGAGDSASSQQKKNATRLLCILFVATYRKYNHTIFPWSFDCHCLFAEL